MTFRISHEIHVARNPCQLTWTTAGILLVVGVQIRTICHVVVVVLLVLLLLWLLLLDVMAVCCDCYCQQCQRVVEKERGRH